MAEYRHIAIGKNVLVGTDEGFVFTGDTLRCTFPFVRFSCMLSNNYMYTIVQEQEHATLDFNFRLKTCSPIFFDVFGPGVDHKIFNSVFELKHKPARLVVVQPANKAYFKCSSELHTSGLCLAELASADDNPVCPRCLNLETVWLQHNMDANTQYPITAYTQFVPIHRMPLMEAFKQLDFRKVNSSLFTQMPEHRFGDLEIIACVPEDVATAYIKTTDNDILAQFSPADKQCVFTVDKYSSPTNQRFDVYGCGRIKRGELCVYLQELPTVAHSGFVIHCDPDMKYFCMFIREHRDHIGIISDEYMMSYAVQGNLSSFGGADRRVQIINTTPGLPASHEWISLASVTELDPDNGTIIILGPLTLGDAMQLFMKAIKWKDGLQVVWISNPYVIMQGYHVFGMFASLQNKFVDVTFMRDEGLRPNPGEFIKGIFNTVHADKNVEFKQYSDLDRGDRAPKTRPIMGVYQKSLTVLIENRQSISTLLSAFYYSEDVSVQMLNKNHNKYTRLCVFSQMYNNPMFNPLARLLKH
jgi:hypothetical protein